MRLLLVACLMMILPQFAQAALGQRCYRLSQKKSFSARDKRLPLLCVRNSNHQFSDAKTRIVTVERRIGNNGSGVGEYVAHIKSQPKCKTCNKTSYRLMNVEFDSPYLVFNGRKGGTGEHGFLMFRGEGYYYSSAQ
jgi:hypothetical protein